MASLLVVLLIGACDSDGTDTPADARPGDAAVEPMDAPFSCTRVAPRVHAPGPACFALAPATLRGTTPLGALDVELDYFGAGDCITNSSATIGWTGACGEQVRLQFPYPVTSDGNGRHVTGSFDVQASFELVPPGMAPRRHVATIHVEVVRWQEGQGVHDIDITVSVLDPLYAVAPWRVVGTFCDWPYYIC